jgi:hypothetical protein
MNPTSFVGVFRSRVHLKSRFYWVLGWALFIGGGAASLAIKDDHVGMPLMATFVAMLALLIPYLLFLFTSFDRGLSGWIRQDPKRIFFAAAYILATYLVYGIGTGVFDWTALGILGGFVGVPLCCLYLSFRSSQPAPVIWDWLAVLSIWVPFDARWLQSIWTWPEGHGAYILNTVLAIDLAVVGFLCFRRIPNLKFRLSMDRQDALLGLKLFLAFVGFAIPAGFLSGFIGWHPNLSWTNIFLTPIGIFFFIAIPEELLFRGIVQNFLIRKLKSPILGILIASLFFGLTHLNNGPAPDWRYGCLAAIAGCFYGYAFTRTRSILVPALIHALVDSIWILLFFNGVR